MAAAEAAEADIPAAAAGAEVDTPVAAEAVEAEEAVPSADNTNKVAKLGHLIYFTRATYA